MSSLNNALLEQVKFLCDDLASGKLERSEFEKLLASLTLSWYKELPR